MAESGLPTKSEGNTECVNLLYLASQKKLQMQKQNSQERVGMFTTSDSDDMEASPTLAELAQSAPVPAASSSEPQRSKPPARDASPQPDTRMSSKARMESQKSFAEDNLVGSICPKVNCTEKIIICLDISAEMAKPTFRSRAGDKFTPMKLAKRALEIFLHSKNRFDRRHEYALVLLKDTAYWMADFTNNPDKIICMLKDFNDVWEGSSFDVGSFFDEIAKQVSLPKIEKPSILPPPYVVRMILLYGRSQCIPTCSSTESQKFLQSSPYFFLDALYIHEPPSEENNCEVIFDSICELDTTGLSFVLEVSKNPTRLYDCMAQLLPHPLQRPLQRDVDYNLEAYGPKENLPL